MRDVCVFQISEDLDKVKQEMEEKGSSMSDGGKLMPEPPSHFTLNECD